MTGHRVVLYDYGAILILTRCPRGRPGLAMLRAVGAVTPCFDGTALSTEPKIDQIGIFFAVTGAEKLETYDKGIHRSKKLGRMLMIDVVVPTWCLNQTEDAEFDEIAEAVVLVALRVAARRLGHDELPFATHMQSRVKTARIAALFAEFLG